MLPAISALLVYALFHGILVRRVARGFRNAGAPVMDDFEPRVAVIVPCTGTGPHLADRVRALLDQDYPDLRVVFVIADEDDPAWRVLAPIVDPHPRGTLVTAGPAQGRGQKVHNLLRGLREAAGAEVVAFADSDVDYPQAWLRTLVAPLSPADVGAATGLCWLEPAGGGSWARGLTWGTNVSSLPLFVDGRVPLAWGGSMAIRASIFDRAGIADVWSGAAYDDLTLAAAVRRYGLRIAFVPAALLPAPAGGGFLDCVRWLRRQAVATRVYTPALYWPNVLLRMPLVTLVVVSPALLLHGLAAGRPTLPLTLLGLLAVRAAAGALVCRVAGRAHDARQAPFLYLGAVLEVVATALSLVRRRFTWAGITYALSRRTTRVVRRTGI